MLLLVIGIVAVFLGVLALPLLRNRPSLVSAIDGFVLVFIGGLVLLHIIPHSIEAGGTAAVVATVIGLALPMLAGRLRNHGGSRFSRRLLIVLALLGVAAHAVVDGMALAAPHLHDHDHHTGELLAFAVVAHRFPTGLALGWIVDRLGGLKMALLVATGIAAATCVGFFTAGEGHIHGPWLEIFNAFVAGSLLHVVFGHAATGASPVARLARPMSAVGALLAMGALYLVMVDHTSQMGTGDTFLVLALETAPALLLAFLIAGILRAFLKGRSLRWLGRGGHFAQSMRGMAFGLPMPVCSCSVVPLYQSLVRSGVPTAAGVSFLVATPEIGIDAMLVSLPLLGGELALIRIFSAAFVALAVAVVVAKLIPESRFKSRGGDNKVTDNRTTYTKITEGLRYGTTDLVDHVMPWLLVGLGIAAMLEPLLDVNTLTSVPWSVQVPLMAVIGMPLYVCASGSTPLAAMLIHKGLSPGAALAFLLTGPATNILTFGTLRNLHGRKAAFVFGGAMLVVACGVGWTIDLLAGDSVSVPPLEPLAEDSFSWLHYGSLAVLGALTLGSLMRTGPRTMVAQVWPSAVADPHGHSHDHDHEGHSHDHDLVAVDPPESSCAPGPCGCDDLLEDLGLGPNGEPLDPPDAPEDDHGHTHGHGHDHGHDHGHTHDHTHDHGHEQD